MDARVAAANAKASAAMQYGKNLVPEGGEGSIEFLNNY